MPLKLSILYFILFFSVSSIFAQSEPEWNSIGLTATGKNIQNGVEAFYQLNKCNNETVVFIKFINHNAYKVAVEWNDAVFTRDLKWVSNGKTGIVKTLTIGGSETISGGCLSKNQNELVVIVNDFISSMDDFNLYGINSFKVSSVIE